MLRTQATELRRTDARLRARRRKIVRDTGGAGEDAGTIFLSKLPQVRQHFSLWTSTRSSASKA